MYEYTIDKNWGQYKAPFNQIYNEARVLTPADTSIPTPNSDTPYSFLWMDLRAEPLVLCVPKVEKNRYYSVEFVDLYTDTGAFLPPTVYHLGVGSHLGSSRKGFTQLRKTTSLFMASISLGKKKTMPGDRAEGGCL